MTKHLTNFFLGCLVFWAASLSAQCPTSTPGLLSGNQAPMFIPVDSIRPAPTFATAPSGLPSTEFLISNMDGLATDSLGPPIIGVSADGSIDPQLYFINPCQTIALTAFSYDIHQIRTLMQALLNENFTTTPFPLSCCAAVGLVYAGMCDTLNAYGIQDSSDVTSISDLLILLNVVAGDGGSFSITGMTQALDLLNSSLSQFGGCSGGLTEICYAVNFVDGSDLLFYTGLGTPATSVSISPDTGFVMSQGGTVDFSATVLPNNSDDVLTWELIGNNSGASIDANGRLTAGTTNDTIFVRARATNGCVDDTAVAIVNLATGVQSLEQLSQLQAMPNPFKEQVTVQWLAQEDDHLFITDLHGRTVWQSLSQGQNAGQLSQVQVPMANLSPGFYILYLQQKQGLSRIKLLKQ